MKAVTPDPHTGMTVVDIAEGTTSLTYVLQPLPIRVVPRANSSVAIYHGSLLYALDVGQSVVTLSPDARLMARQGPRFPSAQRITNAEIAKLYDSAHAAALPPIPPEAHDYQITNVQPWNIAIDTSTLVYHSGSENGSADSSLPSPLWTPRGPPNFITAQGCSIEWPMFNGVPAPVPLPINGTRNCEGPVVNVTLRPFGSLKVHMAELPTVQLSANTTARVSRKY